MLICLQNCRSTPALNNAASANFQPSKRLSLKNLMFSFILGALVIADVAPEKSNDLYPFQSKRFVKFFFEK